MPEKYFPGARQVAYLNGSPSPMDGSSTRRVILHNSDGGDMRHEDPDAVHAGNANPYHMYYNVFTDECIQVAPITMGSDAVYTYDTKGTISFQLCILGSPVELNSNWNDIMSRLLQRDSSGRWKWKFPRIIQWLDTWGIPRVDTSPSKNREERWPRNDAQCVRSRKAANRSGYTCHGSLPDNTHWDGIWFKQSFLDPNRIPRVDKKGREIKVKPGDSASVTYDDLPEGYGLFMKNYKIITTPNLMSARALIGARVIAAGWGGHGVKEINTRANDNEGLCEHPSGKAIDCILDGEGTSKLGREAGQELSRWLEKNAAEMGVSYIIYNKQDWSASNPKWGPYTGPGTDHVDHVHVFFDGKKRPGGPDCPDRAPEGFLNLHGQWRPLPPRLKEKGKFRGVSYSDGATLGADAASSPDALTVSKLLSGKLSFTALSMSSQRSTEADLLLGLTEDTDGANSYSSTPEE